MMLIIKSIMEHSTEWLFEFLPAVFSPVSFTLTSFFIRVCDSKPILKKTYQDHLPAEFSLLLCQVH